MATGIPHAEQHLFRGLHICENYEAVGGDAQLSLVRSTLDPERANWLRRVQADPEQLLLAPESIRDDAVLVKLALESFRLVLPYATERLRADRSVVMTAVTHNGIALQYAAPHLRADRDLVLAALGKRTGSALEFACPDLRAQRRTCEAGLRYGGNAFLFIAERYKWERPMALVAVRHEGRILQFLGAKFRDDEEVVRAAIRCTPCTMR